MSAILGIDLGTTNSLVGVMDAGFPILIADADGERLTPSVVHFPAEGGAIVGRAAQRLRTLQPERTVYSVKRFMGLRGEEAEEEARRVGYSVKIGRGRRVEVRLPDGREMFPEEVAAEVVRKLKADAERAFERSFDRAVVTVPAYFNDAQRNATKAAGEAAGFVVERIVNEPTAAALAYGLDKLKEKARIAVYDFGGGTFDASILELNAGVFQVLATNGNTHLGGDDIDREMMTECERRLEDRGVSLPLPPESAARLREAVVAAKHRLSEVASVTIELPFLAGAKSLSLEVTRGEFEALARPVVERTRSHCRRVLADASLQPADLDRVILVGGTTRMPLVRHFVREFFGQEPDVSQNPDEAVALGATIQAGILSGAVRDMVLLDVTPLSLGLETFGGLMNVIIPRNTTIPVKMGEMFTNAVAGQRSMAVRVLQGEREMARDNWRLGEVELEFEPAPKGRARVGVQFEIDADGILKVLVRDTATGRETVAEIRSAVDVSDEAVEQMIAESVEHAFDDMSLRVWTEAKLKSEEMLPAVRRAMEQVEGQLDAKERERIEELIAGVEAALEAGEAPRLKRANAALDEGTQQLATLVVERAMEEALRRRGAI